MLKKVLLFVVLVSIAVLGILLYDRYANPRLTTPVDTSPGQVNLPTAQDYMGAYVYEESDGGGVVVLARTLNVFDDGVVEIFSEYLAEGTTSAELGTWAVENGQLVANFTELDGQKYENPTRMVFEYTGDSVVAVEYNKEVYGEQSPEFLFVDVEEEGAIDLEEEIWKLNTYTKNSQVVSNLANKNITMTFLSDGGFAGSVCNSIGGKYKKGTSSIVFSEIQMTEKACEDQVVNNIESDLVAGFINGFEYKSPDDTNLSFVDSLNNVQFDFSLVEN